MRQVFVVVVMVLAGCGAPAKVGEQCAVEELFGSSACDQGLVCIHPDACKDRCEGTCRQSCTDDKSCPAGCSCRPMSPENGTGSFCQCGS